MGAVTWPGEDTVTPRLTRWQEALAQLPVVGEATVLLTVNYFVRGNPNAVTTPKGNRFLGYFDDVNAVGVSMLTPAGIGSPDAVDRYFAASLHDAEALASKGMQKKGIEWVGHEDVTNAIAILSKRLAG
jgi:hypothetical protein